tara:strand:+ start:211 stop:342 length:132 start_codon:yes stop_codon:yes gene_type:complete
MVKLIFMAGIVMTLTGCAKDLDINPYTTAFRLINQLSSNQGAQ